MRTDYLTFDQAGVAAGYRAERLRLRAQVVAMDDAALATQSLCDEWRVRDVVAHLTGLVADILGGDTGGAGRPDATARQVSSRADLSMTDLLAEWDEVGEGLAGLIESLDDATWASALPSGQTMGEGAERLLGDIWMHANDINVALGGVPVDGPGLAAAMNVATNEWPLRQAHFSPDLPLTILTGHLRIDVPGGSPVEPAVIAGDPALLALVSADRLTVEAAQAFGRCTVDPRVPLDVLNVYGAPVPGSSMFSVPPA